LKRIGLLSDTHGHIDERIIEHLSTCDEIWHAGDIGTSGIIRTFEALKTFRAVYGNIDGQEIRACFPAIQRFVCEEVDVLMKHIVGYPGHYDFSVIPLIKEDPPKLLIAGHSHILKIMNDKSNHLLYINPGAAGKDGFHILRTLVRFTIDKSDIRDLEVVELGKRV
jgi:uncharacterized protein